MPLLCKRLMAGVLLPVCLLPVLGIAGCGWLTDGALRELSWAPSARPAEADQTLESTRPQPPSPNAESSGDRAVLSRSADAAGRSVWIRAVPSSQGDSAEAGRRWRYPALEELIARPPDQSSVGARRPNWHRYLADADPVVAGNAAIALAQCGDGRGAERLAEVVRTTNATQPMRCAAVEALAGLQGPSVVALLRGLLDQYGRLTPEPGTMYHADLHAELIRGLARHVDPADDPRFVAALRSRSANVRLEALRAWADGRRGELPSEAADLRGDTDRDVRAAAIRTLARRRHPAAQKYVIAALQDHDLTVRTAAIAALGELGGSQSQAALASLLKDQPEVIRAAAVSALAQLGAEQEVLGAAGDRSWRVRLNVAQALAGDAQGNAAAAARQLLQDPSAAVQRQVVLALAKWPLPQAGPILLEAMGSRSLITRETAAGQLAARWPPAAEFPLEGPPQRRLGVLEELQRRFREQFGLGQWVAPTGAAAGGPPAATITPQTVDQVAALDRLASSDVSERREAAGQLAQLARQRPLGPLATARLAELVVAEPDELVWESVLTTVADDASEPSVRLAYAAISHPSAEIRRRACDHLAAHPSPGHAKVLVPTLEDRNEAVVRAAVRALGAAGRLDDVQPLRRVLRTTNEYLRLEAAVALVRLGDPAGPAALERLAYSADPKVRCQVALAMGETAQPTFVPILIRLLDDRPAVCRAALEGLPKTVGHDVSASEDGPPAGTSQRVRRWKQWFDRRQDLAAGGVSAEST